MSSTQGVDELKNEPWFPSLSRRTLLGFLVSAWSTRSGFSSTSTPQTRGLFQFVSPSSLQRFMLS
jgi:hypothetical protein